MKITPIVDYEALLADQNEDGGVSEPSVEGMNPEASSPAENGNQDHHHFTDAGHSPPELLGTGASESDQVLDPSRIDALLAEASKLYSNAVRKEEALLKERIELGGILNRLKDEVGHGNFLKEFKKWQKEGKINFSYTTANRAMAYADLDADGKLSSVRNLAEAEKVRKEVEAQKKRERANMTPPEVVPDDDEPLPKLEKPQIGLKARQLAKPALDGCHGYDTETRELLLEELIEILTKELEKCS